MNTSIKIAHAYLFAKQYIISKGFGDEIDWQNEICFDALTESKFLHEISWVIIASGMSDKVVRKIFPKIKTIMYDFKSSKSIVTSKKTCLNKALTVFNHRGKLEAIISIANYIDENSFQNLKNRISLDGINFLQTFPYMGKATSYHLAKNIGFDVAKPDRHLVRISNTLGFEDPNELCKIISNKIHEKISLIDLVLWRYATIDKNYISNLNWFISHPKYDNLS